MLQSVNIPCNGRNLVVRPIGHLEAGKLAHLKTADIGEAVVADLQTPEAGHLGLDPQFFEVVVAEAKGLEGPQGGLPVDGHIPELVVAEIKQLPFGH